MDAICKYNKLKSSKKKGGEFFLLLCIVLAAWPSGKAGDCKSFFPSSNPGAASSTNELKFLILLCCFILFWEFCKKKDWKSLNLKFKSKKDSNGKIRNNGRSKTSRFSSTANVMSTDWVLNYIV